MSLFIFASGTEALKVRTIHIKKIIVTSLFMAKNIDRAE